MQVLAERGTCICGELVEELPLAQASVSRHIKVLKDAGLIRGEIDGPRSCYYLDRAALRVLGEQLNAFFAALPASSTDSRCC